MHIRAISVHAMHRSNDGKRLWGEVDFDIAPTHDKRARMIKISCDIAFSTKIRPDAILIGDAVRQLRRLPEIRNGEERMTFEPGMKPLAAQNSFISMDKHAATG